jgi:hypothetical protein
MTDDERLVIELIHPSHETFKVRAVLVGEEHKAHLQHALPPDLIDELWRTLGR